MAKPTYEELETILLANHFYPSREVSVGTKDKKITGLQVECPAIIRMDDIVNRLEEILTGTGAKVHKFPNQGYISIVKK